MVDKLKKKGYLIKANRCLNHNKYKITKKIIAKRKSYNKFMNKILLFIILDMIFLSRNTSENSRKAQSTNKITYYVLGGGNMPIYYRDESSLGNPNGNTQNDPPTLPPNRIRINGTEVFSNNNYYNFKEGLNKVELFWDGMVICKKLFKDLDKIISIDFSEFSSERERDMSYMFSGCKSLTSINFGNNFDTSYVEDMEYMFSECKKLKAVDLSLFKTNNVKNMNRMFYNSKSLIYLDLLSFDTSLVSTMSEMFLGCDSLVYINLYSFVEKNDLQYNGIFNNNIKQLIYCINSEKAPNIYNILHNANLNNNCDNDCFNKSYKVIPEKKICIEDCGNDDTYKYEYEDIKICYDKEASSSDTSDDPESSEESSESSEESSESSEESSESPEESSKSSEESHESPKESKENSEESHESPEESNESFEESTSSSEETEKLENYESSLDSNNEEKFDAENFFKESKQTNEEELEKKDEVIKSLKENIMNGNMNSSITNLINGEKEDLIAEYKDITFQLTTTENQKDGSYNNISTIDLGECEDILKRIYGIDSNLSLVILKVDYKMEGLLIPVIGYEVYHPTNYSQLNLTYCKNTSVKLNIPVSINEEEAEKYDPNSGYYNDECYAYTTENGTDIILNDRKDEYVDKNLSLCENNCDYKGYNSETKKAICMCVTKAEISYISDIITDSNLLSNNLNKTESSKTNISTMKCVSLLFSKNGLIRNIASYIIFFTLIIFALGFFFFYKCGYQLIEDKVKEIIQLKTNNINNKEINNDFKKNKSKSSNSKRRKSKINISNPNNKKSKKMKNMNFKVIDQNLISARKSDIKQSFTILNNTEKNGKNEKNISVYRKKNQKEKICKNINSISFKESELNLLKYKDAKIFDKRTFVGYYRCLNKIKIWILFAFFPMDDYNIKIIKICLFFLCFVIYFCVNTFFFNDGTFHQIYLDGGKYNFLYFLPQIIYSFFISHLISDVLKYFSLSERNLLELKEEKNLEEINDKEDNVKRCLIIKYIIFFIISFIFLIFFWYYLSSFCAVYQNTQIYLLINTLICFIISSVFSLAFNLIPCILRIISLKNQNSEVLYNISKFLQIV